MKTKEVIKEWDQELLVLLLLTVIGAGLRLYNLGFNSLWLDEAATYSLSVVPLGQIWTNMAAGEFNPPLFFIIQHFMIMIGNTEIALRIMPALFGIATIPVIYLVGKEFMDKYVGLIITAAFTLSPFLVVYSQEARAYSLLLLLCAAMLLFFLKAMPSNHLIDWLPFAGIAVLAIWTHFYSFVFIVTLVAYAGVIHRGNLKPLFLSMTLWFALCLPIFYALGGLIRMRTATPPTYGIQGVGILYETFKEFSGYSDILLIIVLLLLAGGLLWSYFNAYEQFCLTVWLITAPILASVFLSFVIPMLPRYLIFLIIPFFLGIAMLYRPLTKIFAMNLTLLKPVYTVMYFIMFFGMIATPFYMNYYQGYTKEDWRGVAKDLEEMTSPGDVVIAVPNYIILPLGYYYNATADGTAFNGLSTMEGLEVARQAIPNTTWYVITPDIQAVDPHMQAGTWLMQNSFIVKEYGGVVITRSFPNG